jgi:hypothetical protein
MKSAFFEGMRETPVASQILAEDYLDSESISYIHLTDYKGGACVGAVTEKKGGGNPLPKSRVREGGRGAASVLYTTSLVC